MELIIHVRVVLTRSLCIYRHRASIRQYQWRCNKKHRFSRSDQLMQRKKAFCRNYLLKGVT